MLGFALQQICPPRKHRKMELTEEHWVAHAYQKAFALTTFALIQAFGHVAHEGPGEPAPRESILQKLIHQVGEARQSFEEQVPEDFRKRCVAPFETLQDILRVLVVAHPGATAGELTEEMRDLTVLLRAMQPRSGE